MKRILLHSAIAIIALLTLSACLDDDNPNKDDEITSLTNQEIELRNQMLNGNWEGKAYYFNVDTQKYDSTTVVWRGDVSLLTTTIDYFPVRILSNYLEGNAKEILKEADNQKIVFDYKSFTSDLRIYNERQYLRYDFVPQNSSLTFRVGGEEVIVRFTNEIINSEGTYKPIAVFYKSQMTANILIKYIEMKGQTIEVNKVIAISGRKIKS